MNHLLSLCCFLCLSVMSGCGVGLMHADETTTLPSGNTLHVSYWIYAGHFLSDPELGEATKNADGSWTIKGFKGTTDNAGLQSVVTGIGDAVLHLFGKP